MTSDEWAREGWGFVPTGNPPCPTQTPRLSSLVTRHSPTMIYLLRDDLLGEERVDELRASLGAADAQSLNLTVLDGARLSLGELRSVVEAMPFLSDRRMVVVRRFFSTSRASTGSDATPNRRGKADAERETAVLDYLPNVPDFAILVFVEDEDLKSTHAAVKTIRKLGGDIHLDDPPRGVALERWMSDRARKKGGRVESAAVHALAEAEFTDLRELDGTLDLLLTYAGDRPVTAADVQELVTATRAATVFDLVDAVGMRDRRAALGAYRRLLRDSQSPIYLLTMLARQFRLLVIAREALDNHEDIAAALKSAPFVAQKFSGQARLYSMERLTATIERLARTDQSIKTGQADEEVALELLLVELTER